MALVDGIEIRGLREFQRALRDMDGESQKKLRLVFNEAADMIAGPARRLTPSDSGRLRKSIKARSGQREAKVQMGSKRASYAGWIEFGGRLPGGQRRRYIGQGRSLYPTLGRRRREIHAKLADALVALVREQGMEVS